MTDKELIKDEIERLYKHYLDAQEFDSGYNRALDDILQFIDSLPEEPASEDLQNAAKDYVLTVWASNGHVDAECFSVDNQTAFIAGAEWQKTQDESLFRKDSWMYIEETYPGISQEEKT